MDNPYTSPSNASASASSLRRVLYSPGQIAWAAFLGAPIAGCILFALNYKRLGNAAAANVTWLAGLIGTVLIFTVAFFLPDSFPSFVLPAAYTFGLYQCAKSLQGEDYQYQIAHGGMKGSGWVATGIGILCLVVILVVTLAIVFALPDEWLGEELQ